VKQTSSVDSQAPSPAQPEHAHLKVTVITLICLLSTSIFSLIARAQATAPTNASADPAAPVVAAKTAAEEIPLSPPEVIYEDGQLSINASNSTLGDILAAVRKVMGADIDMPPKASRERMAAKLGPGPAREVISSLLSWTDYNYLIQASDSDPDGVQSILLTARTKSPNANPTRAARVQASGAWAPQPRASARTKEDAASDSSDDDQAAASPGPQSATAAEQVAQGSSQPAATPAVASASASAPPATADSQEAPAEIAQSSKSETGDNQAPKSSERIMQLQSLYEQRRQMIQEARKSSSQD